MSRTLAVTAAIAEIASTFKRLEEEGTHASRAYFFVVGAGISTPQVKLAGAIEEECRQSVPGAAIPAEAAANPMHRYSFWLEQAHPNRVQRQRYFRRMIETSAISAANFRLAHLIMSGHAPRLVVTPNFDDFLTRALTLFGARPIVSDHPESAVRIDPESDDIQVLHVHGTYWFYDCCNLDGEIRARAATGTPHQNVSWRLSGILDRRSPIVLGYSGWEDDALMRSLKARLEAPSGLPYNLYWFCYRGETIDALPAWLVDHADVCLVVPEPAGFPPGAGRASRGTGDGGEEQPTAGAPEPVGEPTGTPRLEAVTVLDRLNRALGLDEPELTRNPIGFFADHLRSSLLVGEQGDGEDGDVYRLRWTIERLSEMRSQWWAPADEPRTAQDDLSALLTQVQSAVRRSQHREAIAIARQIPLDALSAGQRAELRETAMVAATGLLDDSEDELAGYDLIVALGDEPDGAEEVATALLYRGITLGQLGRDAEAVETYDALIERYAASADPAVRSFVGQAMRNKAFRLGELGRDEDAIATFDRLLDRCGDDPGAKELIAVALSGKAFRLGELGRQEQAVETYDALIARYGDDPDPQVKGQVTAAMLNKGYQLGKLGSGEQAVETYDGLIARYGDDPDPEVEFDIATAMRNKGYRLGELGRGEEALATFDQLLDRYQDARDPRIQVQLATALVNKGFRLGSLGRGDEEIANYDALVARYGDDPHPEIQYHVANAIVNKGYRLGELGRDEEALAVLDSAIARYGGESDVVLRSRGVAALIARAGRLELLGRADEARAAYEGVVGRFGEDRDPDIAATVAHARAQLERLA